MAACDSNLILWYRGAPTQTLRLHPPHTLSQSFFFFFFFFPLKTTPVSHNQFLNSSTAAGIQSITMKYTFSYFSNLSFDKVTFVKANFPLGSTAFSPGLDYPSNTYTPPSTSLLSSVDLHLSFFFFPPFLSISTPLSVSPLFSRVFSLFSFFPICLPFFFPILLIMNARR